MAPVNRKNATMTAKPKSKASAAATSPDQDAAHKAAVAKIAIHPGYNAAAVLEKYGSAFGTQDVGALCEALKTSMTKVQGGSLADCEAMLMGQAHALQAIFMNLSRRSASHEYLKQMETFLRLALKAQSQCRATLETLASIKNPPVVFARQANIANGPQQVNNSDTNTGGARMHAGNNFSEPNKLLEASDERPLDTGATCAAIGANTPMPAMAEIDRTA